MNTSFSWVLEQNSMPGQCFQWMNQFSLEIRSLETVINVVVSNNLNLGILRITNLSVTKTATGDNFIQAHLCLLFTLFNKYRDTRIIIIKNQLSQLLRSEQECFSRAVFVLMLITTKKKFQCHWRYNIVKWQFHVFWLYLLEYWSLKWCIEYI